MPSSVVYVYAVFCPKILYVQAFSIYREAAANKDDRDMPMSIIVSLTVTTKRFWKFVIDSLLDILAPLLPMTSFIIES